MPTNKKPKPETKIASINLVLTATIGVAGILITLYLNFRNEQLQKQLLELQNKAEIANINITYENGIINVDNLGPATAQDMRLVLCITSIDPKWTNSINDISGFEITIDNPAIESSVQIGNARCDSKLADPSAYLITVKSVPPQESIKVKIKPSNTLSINNEVAQIDAYIWATESSLGYTDAADATPEWVGQTNSRYSGRSFMFSPLYPALLKALDEYLFKIVDIEVSMACQNCNSYKRDFILSSLIDLEFSDIDIGESTDDLKLLVEININFYLPIDVNSEPLQDLYLAARWDNPNQIILVKRNKFEFMPAATNTPEPP